MDLKKYYVVCKKANKENLTVKAINPVYEVIIIQYNNKQEITITNLVETRCLTRYPGYQKSCMTKDQNLTVISSEIPN